MKKIIVIITAICFGAFSLQNANAKGGNTTTKHTATAYMYRCPVCGASSAKPGDCPKDKVTMVKVGEYYCPDCYMTSTKPGKCSMCGVAMKQMTAPSAPAVKASASATK